MNLVIKIAKFVEEVKLGYKSVDNLDPNRKTQGLNGLNINNMGWTNK